MSIPTHNLYDFVNQVTENKFVLLYFYPWGEKSLSNLIINQEYFNHCKDRVSDKLFPGVSVPEGLSLSLQPTIVCHDQEPLNFDLYCDQSEYVKDSIKTAKSLNYDFFSNYNLRYAFVASRQKHWILLHSEINSPELAKYEQTGQFRGAYWWSHAVIARDWYRYAQHDQRLQPQDLKKIFLIYCRDTSGSRQYRKVFLEKLNAHGLDQHVNFGHHGTSPVSAAASAEYDHRDFSSTGISVILETVFEDRRIHFTEKILRAIACGHPFIVANGQGSLTTLKKYGFKTFEPWIDETYDTVPGHQDRMDLIIKELDRIAHLPDHRSVIAQCRDIAKFNQQHFFSDTFFNTVVDELKYNVNAVKLDNFGIDHSLCELMHLNRDHSNIDPLVVKSMSELIGKLKA